MAGPKLKLKSKLARPSQDGPPWPILVVDDDDQVHAMTRLLIRDFEFEGRGFELVSASSSDQAQTYLDQNHPNIPVILLDVVMETPDAGLRLVDYIRNTLKNDRIRIVLRTGQPGEAPERDVMLNHDINDYKSKAELTAQKLFTALVGAIRSWRDLTTIATLNHSLSAANAELEMRVQQRTAQLEDAKSQAEHALARECQARQDLHQFLGMVSHEFRTPLAVIDSAAQMLTLKARQIDKAMLPRLDNIRGSVHRLLDLLDNCLTDEQLQTGKINLKPASLDIGKMLTNLAEQYGASHPGRYVHLAIPNLPDFWGDKAMLTMAFSNLISNALKYSPPHDVHVVVEQQGQTILIKVQDHGIGIPAKDMEKIFDRFYRADNTGKTAGTGIGLHTAQTIITLHRGRIWAKSDSQGTTFFVSLPLPKGQVDTFPS